MLLVIVAICSVQIVLLASNYSDCEIDKLTNLWITEGRKTSLVQCPDEIFASLNAACGMKYISAAVG